jgi:hypothetical protein
MKLHSIILSLIATAVVVPSVRAQLPAIDPVATQLAEALAHSKQKSVIVFDFWGPDQTLTALGRTAAQSLSTALAKKSLRLEVLDRSGIAAACLRHGLSASNIHDPSIEIWIGRDLGARRSYWAAVGCRRPTRNPNHCL